MNPPAWVVGLLLVVIFGAGFALRARDLGRPGQLIEREYRSALIARDLYLGSAESVPAWRLEAVRAARQRQQTLEPPVTEFLAATTYRLAGREDIRLARLLVSMIWLVGGAFLFLVARRLFGVIAGLAATAYYVLFPLGVHLGRSFQPDALMMLGLLTATWCVLRYSERPAWNRLAIAAALAGASVLARPQVVFLIAAGFVALWLTGHESRSGVADSDRGGTHARILHALTFLFVTMLPSALWYGSGILLDDGNLMHAGSDIRLRTQAEMSFRPWLLSERGFWKEWALLAWWAIGTLPLIGGAVGLFFMKPGRGRRLALGWGAGYVLLGCVFTYHIHTHGYYHAVLAPAVGLALGVAVARAVEFAATVRAAWPGWVVAVLALLLAAPLYLSDFRSTRTTRRIESAEIAAEIGAVVKHSTNTAFVSHAYGLPLQYQGELSGQPWPHKGSIGVYRRAADPELDVPERLAALGIAPEYFIITDLDRYRRRHEDLAAFLEARCRPLAATGAYLVYDRCRYEVDAEEELTTAPLPRRS